MIKSTRLEHELPIGYSQRGAWMGRRSDPLGFIGDERVRLQRMHLDSGGYDCRGAYWGLPSDLYIAVWNCGGERYQAFLRAVSRDDAKQQIRAEAPDTKFYR